MIVRQGIHTAAATLLLQGIVIKPRALLQLLTRTSGVNRTTGINAVTILQAANTAAYVTQAAVRQQQQVAQGQLSCNGQHDALPLRGIREP
jgi:hypothetical protein